MQSFLVDLLARSFSLSLLALLYVAFTPVILKRYQAKWCYYAWLAIVVSLILPFRLHIGGSLIAITIPTEEATAVIEGFPASSAYAHNWIESTVHSLSGLSGWDILAFAWVLGVLIFFAYHILRHCRFLSTVRRWSEAITDTQTLSIFQNVKEDLGITGKVYIKKCSCIQTPMLVGFIQPTILLPSGAYVTKELDVILKHELVHLKRGDLWYRLLIFVVMCIHWFNPLLHFTAKKIANLCELSCDDEVVKNMELDLRKQYCKTILLSAKKLGVQTTFSTDFVGGQSDTKKRAVTIMNMTPKRTGFVVIFVLLILALVASSAFSASETPIDYLNQTFMKERVVSGAAFGDFSTDKYIIYPEGGDIDKVPPEPAGNRDVYSDTVSGATIIELRYRYPFEMIQKDDSGKKYITRVFFDYDYELSGDIAYQELNDLVGSYLVKFRDVFMKATFNDLVQEDRIFSLLEQCKEYVDDNTDPRLRFRFYLSGIGGDAPITMSPEKKGGINALTFN